MVGLVIHLQAGLCRSESVFISASDMDSNISDALHHTCCACFTTHVQANKALDWDIG